MKNNVNLQRLNSKILALINWLFGVNRSALVPPAKTLTDPRALRIRTDDLKNEEQKWSIRDSRRTNTRTPNGNMGQSKEWQERKWDIGIWQMEVSVGWLTGQEIKSRWGQDFAR